MLTRRRGLGERGDKILRWRHSNCTHCDACRRETAECSHKRRSEVRAGRQSSRFRLGAYRTVQTRPVSSRSVHHGIFPDFYFYTHSLQRPHERRPMASRREQVSALFFVAWTQRRLTECFPWATEGPNPPKETLTFKKEFFWQTTSGSLPAGLNCTCLRASSPISFLLSTNLSHVNFLIFSTCYFLVNVRWFCQNDTPAIVNFDLFFSDTGAMPPESCIFTLGLSISAFLGEQKKEWWQISDPPPPPPFCTSLYQL